jgi:flagellar hook-associated protein 1
MAPASLAARRDSIGEMQGFLARLGQIGDEISSARSDADRRVGEQVARVNVLLSEIADSNATITRARALGDVTGAEQRQSDLINELSTYVDIRSIQRPDGSIEIRTTNGTMLAGQQAATLSFQPTTNGQTSFDRIQIQFGTDPTKREFEPSLQSGSLRGLIDVRDKDLSEIADSLGELGGRIADALNAAHNQNATLPPLSTAVGSDTGLLASDTLGFTGKTSIGVITNAGVLNRKIEIDFDLGTISVDGVVTGATGATVASFTAALNTALGPMGTASFGADGKMRMTAAAGQGLVFDEPDTGGSLRGDKAFAHFFGLNDLVRSGTPTSFATGLSGTDAHGFPVGQSVGFKLIETNGSVSLDREISVPAGDLNSLMTALNDPSTGLGLYGTMSLDSTGKMVWTPAPGQESIRMELTKDVGPRGGTGRGFGQMFGLSASARETRATSLSVDPEIVANPAKLSFAKPDLSTATLGQVAVGIGDSRGAQALFDVTRTRMDFNSGSSIISRSMTLSDFASALGGDVGSRAGLAEVEKNSAEALKEEASTRRSNVEGVNLDEELVKLTSFQQAYSAAARMIRAADEMYQALLNAV